MDANWTIPLLFALCLWSSCALWKPKPAPRPKAAVEVRKKDDAVGTPEGRGGAAELYREMRARNWKGYTKGRRGAKPKRRYGTGRRGAEPKRRYGTGRRRSSRERREALGRELGQNKDYFCIVRQGRGRFPTAEDCRRFVDRRDRECRRIHGEALSRKLVSCLKRRLK